MRNLLILLTVLYAMSNSLAQVINDGQVITISLGTEMTVLGLEMTNQGEIINDGQLSVQSDWKNTGTYQSNSGSFKLIGNNQTIDHGTSTFNELIVSGGGIKALTSDLHIATTLNLNSGILEPESSSLVNLALGADIMNGGEASYVSGTLSRIGSGDLLYPVGTDDEYLPVTLTGVLSGGSGIGVIAISGSPVLSVDEELKSISDDHFWQLTSEENDFAGGIRLPLVNESFISTTEQAVIAYSNEILPFSSLGVTSIDGDHLDGNIFSEHSISSGSYVVGNAKQNQTIAFEPITEKRETDGSFTLSATASSGLPITYTSSNEAVATIEGNVVTIINSRRPQNGVTTITASQEGNEDFSAAIEVSQELIINWVLTVDDRSFDQVNIYPIPFQSVFHITLPGQVSQKHELIIYDFSGRQIVNRSLVLGSQSYVVSDLSQMPEGMYTIQLVSDKNHATYRILKGDY